MAFLVRFLGEHHHYLLAVSAGAVVNRAAALVLPLSLRFLIDSIVARHRTDLLPFYCAGVLAATGLQASTSYWLNFTVAMRAHEIMCGIRRQLTDHVFHFPLVRHESGLSGAATTRITHDSDSIRHIVGFPMVDLVSAGLTGVIAAIAILRINAELAFVCAVFITLAAAGLLISVVISRSYLRQRSVILAETNGQLAEAMASIRILKAFCSEDGELAVYRQNLDRFLANVAETTALSSKVAAARAVIVATAGLLLVWVGVQQIAQGALTLGGLMTVVALWALLAGAMLQAGAAAIQISESLAGLDRICELFRVAREDDDPVRSQLFKAGRGHILFDNVSFSYREGEEVLKEVTFDVAPETTVAIIGSSGAGKSTIGGLVAGLYSASSGRVLVDGFDLREVVLSSYRKRIGLVPQDVGLLGATIRDNILLGNRSATEREFTAACQAANVYEFVDRLPQGYDTWIGEHGAQLSGGQRQRIAIARALVADPKVLILDEPTAQLDRDSAELVIEALERIRHGRTVVIIAHSPNAIRFADEILVVADGRIVSRTKIAGMRRAIFQGDKRPGFDAMQCAAAEGVATAREF